ncbi:MAG: tyrosine--tRNA ligase [Planctomycetes bacterium]|nr:tyrosine--tRNA ligase [Planctomycetota bacterium]
MSHGDYLGELSWRGMLHQATDGLKEHLAGGQRTGYCGFDPTADSLTVGNLVSVVLLARLQRAGHRPIAVVGGATGMIGDPSGKASERTLLDADRVRHNLHCQKSQMERMLDFTGPCAARIVNNADWLGSLGYIDMLRDIGKHFSVNQMIARDSVSSRLEGREQGISYTEFSYMILQAYDFLHLFRATGCTLQVGGSDQFGNIVSGVDLIRRLEGTHAFGATAPLLLKADGTKFGKSESGNVWLSAEKTSPYRFHQFFLNASDDQVGQLLRWFTFMSREEVEALEASQKAAPQERAAQKALADAVTDLVHGTGETARARAAAAALFSGDVRGLDAALLRDIASDLPSSEVPAAHLAGEGLALLDLLPTTSLAASKREAREFLGAGAVSVNGEKIAAEARLTSAHLLHGEIALLRRGKKLWHVVRASHG